MPESSASLVVFNLGYLPGGDKEVTTTAEGTTRALLAAERAVMPGGAVSVTLYPGHAEGEREAQAVLEHVAALDVGRWSVVHTRWPNQVGKRTGLPSPELLELQCMHKGGPKEEVLAAMRREVAGVN